MTSIVGQEMIALARLQTLKAMLGLEMKGLKRHGRSAYAIIKAEHGFKGNRQRVYDQLSDLIKETEDALFN